MGAPVTISTASVPTDHCVGPIQTEWPFLVSLLSAELAGANNTFNAGDTTPAPDDQNKPWLPPSFSGANPPAFGYHFVDGVWIMPNPNPSGVVVMYRGTEASIETFDGGEAGTVTATTGPMWQKVSEMDGKFPIGPGTVGATLIGVGDTGGTHEHTLTLANIPPHTHGVKGRPYTSTGNLTPPRIIVDDDYGSADLDASTESAGGTGTPAAAQVISHLSPYVGIWFIVRTARQYYRR